MINKIFVFLGIALIAILIVENMVVQIPAYLFWINSRVRITIIFSSIIGIFIGYGLYGMLNLNNKRDDYGDNDFDF